MDKSQFEQLYSDNFKKLYKFFYYKTLNKHIAEDLTSETFMRLANQSISSVLDLKSYLFGIARIIFVEYLKKKYKQEISVGDDIEKFIDYVEQNNESFESKKTLEDELIKILPELPEKQSEIIKLRLIDKLKPAEIAKRLNRSMIYVKTMQNRAIKSIKKVLETRNFI